jgi:hypothetical protein
MVCLHEASSFIVPNMENETNTVPKNAPQYFLYGNFLFRNIHITFENFTRWRRYMSQKR